jgi:hypothetical protein
MEEKRRQAAALPKCRPNEFHLRNAPLEFPAPEIKKAAEKPPQSEEIRTLTQTVEYQMKYSASRSFRKVAGLPISA